MPEASNSKSLFRVVMVKICQRLPLISLLLPAVLALSGSATLAASYDGFRWFQVEISIFSNEYPEYRNAELWSPASLNLSYPQRSREFARLADFFQVENFEQRVLGITGSEEFSTELIEGIAEPGTESLPPETGPFPHRPAADLRLPDFERDPYLLLPRELSNFQTTNARLESSANNRLLFTGLWRQPVVGTGSATALIVRGGRQYGEHFELEGNLTIRFNQNEDRVVIDTDLWLTEFTAPGTGDSRWQLPPAPPGRPATETANGINAFGISRIIQMRQSRDMRSNEFHYLDHPALGLVISVQPYDLPPPLSLPAPLAADPPQSVDQ
jgi:hypothetical protein